MARGLLILDLDGTLVLGDGPVMGFAAAIAETAGAAPASLLDPLERFLAGRTGTEFDGCADGYIAVGRWAAAHGLGAKATSAAFQRSRVDVDSGRIPVHAPDRAVARLRSMARWHRVLVTNSPRASAETLIERLGFAGALDAVIGDARKPGGLERLVGPGGRLDAGGWDRVVSIGDIWDNDLAPVHAVGGQTGLIERHAQPHATPTWRAGDLQQALEQL